MVNVCVRAKLRRLQFGLSAEDVQVLSSCLSPVVHAGLEVSVTAAANLQLLRDVTSAAELFNRMWLLP